MILTASQKQALKQFIDSDPELSAIPNTYDGAFEIAERLKQEASPDFWVWRTSVSKEEIVSMPSRAGTSFTWAGTGFIGRSQGEIACWEQLFSTGHCNPSLVNVRQAFADIFSGTGNAASNRTHLDKVCRRKANRLEKLFAVGEGLDTTAGAATMTVEGSLTYQEVWDARNP